MSGSLGYETGHSPIGYVTPSFPSLSFDFTGNPYTSPLLFYGWDIYVFTVYWHLIFAVGFHAAVVVVTFAVHSSELTRRRLLRLLGALVTYCALGAFYGFAVGSFIGLLLSSVYEAGALHMSTWVPFTWGLCVMVFAVIFSYEGNAVKI